MPIFTCDCCSYTTAYKSNHTRHLNSKNHYINLKCNGKTDKSVTDNVTVSVTELKNVTDEQSNNKKYDCPYCCKTFSHRQNVYEHKKICKFKENPKPKIDQSITNQINNTSNITNNNTTNNTNCTINNVTNKVTNHIVLNYNQTDLSKLTDQHFIKALNAVNFCINKMIELVHFNPEIPENMNIKYTNINKNRIQYKDNETWKVLNKGIDEVYDSYESIMDEWNDFNKTVYPTSAQKYEKYLENREQRLQDIKENLKMRLYNNTLEHFK